MTPESIESLTFPAEIHGLIESALAGVDGAAAVALVAGTIAPRPVEAPDATQEAA
ncbi:MAG TPA: hypothetical protein VNT32_02165 [Thermoleophilaceae bacterium]|nr:hypothetical protein [Thermoleophilaceae bacterium]